MAYAAITFTAAAMYPPAPLEAPVCDPKAAINLTNARTLAFERSSKLAPMHIFHPSALRDRLLGKWLYLCGDSSTRGLWLTLYQQLAADNVMNLTAWLGLNHSNPMNLGRLAWSDVVIDDSGQLLRTESGVGGSGCVTWGCSADDLSAGTRKPWPVASAIRITYRFVGASALVEQDAFTELQSINPPPDFHVLQMGSWDHAKLTHPDIYAQQLHGALRRWQAAASSSSGRRSGHVATRLAFVTMPIPYHIALGGDSCGSWHSSLLKNASPAGVEFVNRIESGAQLERSLGAPSFNCSCIRPYGRPPGVSRNRMSHSMRYHPPHIHNLWDIQRLVGQLLSPRPLAPNTRARGASAIELAGDLVRSCCCEPPPRETNAVVDLPLSVWANMCRVRPRAARESV